MTCYRPVTAFRPEDGGPLVFSQKKNTREIQIKCGQCIGCRLEKRESWAIRCILESKMHRENSFVTLTYSEDQLPMHESLCYRDMQLFLKRLRRKVGKIRFFAAGEYGDSFKRPHFHVLLFGVGFGDRVRCNSVYSKQPVYRSPTLESLWTAGFSTIGEVTYESARYCASYVLKKMSGPKSEEHYERVVSDTGEIVTVVPEMARMSLRPGIGFPWLEKYWRDLYESGANAVIVNGSRKKIPRFFDQKMDELVPLLMDSVEYERYKASLEHSADRSAERLAVREQCELARMAFDKTKQRGWSYAL